MASTAKRRPLPALVSLLALLLLTALVWWRVLNRGGASTGGQPTPCPTHTAAVTLPAPAKVTVRVLNSTTHAGIGARARMALLDAGFTVPAPAGNDDHKRLNKITKVAEIRFGPSGQPGAALLRYYLPGAVLVSTTSKSATVVVSLGTAYRQVASPAAVQAALKHDDTIAGSPAPPSAGAPNC